jgi:hypothetical protein
VPVKHAVRLASGAKMTTVDLIRHLPHFLGIDGGSYYYFYSGIAAAAGTLSLLGGIATYWSNKKCAVDGCRHPGKMQAGPWRVCPGHHPHGQATPEKLRQWADAQAASEG